MCMIRGERWVYEAGELSERSARLDRRSRLLGGTRLNRGSRTSWPVATLPGPSKTITVEPIEVPAPREEPVPVEPEREPAKEPDKQPAPAK